jgi:tryptophan synthase alpha chain
MSIHAIPDNRIDCRIAASAKHGRGALLPYLTAGYPDAGSTVEWIRRFDARGLAAVEIGFPYSDSVADGPVIQESFNRVLARGFKVDEAFALAAEARRTSEIALIAMASSSIVHRRGAGEFVRRARGSGFDGLIVPDVPFEEAAAISEAAAAEGLRHILLVASSTPPERARRIATLSTGFVYQVSSRGLTGERGRLPDDLQERVSALRAAADRPVCVGFGVGTAGQVREVCQAADGVIVGSAIVRRISESLDAGKATATLVEEVSSFVDDLATGTL